MFLMGKGYWDYIERGQEEALEILEGNSSAAQIRIYKDGNQGAQKVLHWLSLSITSSMLGHIQEVVSPKIRKLQLKIELNTLEKGKMLVNEYALKIRVFVSHLHLLM
jgi:hypothetical protein